MKSCPRALGVGTAALLLPQHKGPREHRRSGGVGDCALGGPAKASEVSKPLSSPLPAGVETDALRWGWHRLCRTAQPAGGEADRSNETQGRGEGPRPEPATESRGEAHCEASTTRPRPPPPGPASAPPLPGLRSCAPRPRAEARARLNAWRQGDTAKPRPESGVESSPSGGGGGDGDGGSGRDRRGAGSSDPKGTRGDGEGDGGDPVTAREVGAGCVRGREAGGGPGAGWGERWGAARTGRGSPMAPAAARVARARGRWLAGGPPSPSLASAGRAASGRPGRNRGRGGGAARFAEGVKCLKYGGGSERPRSPHPPARGPRSLPRRAPLPASAVGGS
jgi:hypothetical protein